MEILPTQVFIYMDKPSKCEQIPAFLQQRLAKEKPSLTKEQLQAKLARAEELRLNKIQEKKQHAAETQAKIEQGKSRKQEMMTSGDYYMEMCHGERMKKYIRDLYKPNSSEEKISVAKHQRQVLN